MSVVFIGIFLSLSKHGLLESIRRGQRVAFGEFPDNSLGDREKPTEYDIKLAFRNRSPNGEALLYRNYESYDSGVVHHHFEVISENGLYLGYFTDEESIPHQQDELISRVMNENLLEWRDLQNGECADVYDFLSRSR